MKLHWQILVAIGLGAKRNWHIFFALIFGVLVGVLFPVVEGNKQPIHMLFDVIGHGFISLIQMVVIPLIVSAIIVGIASFGDSKQLGKVGLKMVLYYTIITVFAVGIGAGLSSFIKPGENIQSLINQNQASAVRHKVQSFQAKKTEIEKIALTSNTGEMTSGSKVLHTMFKLIPNIRIIPENPVESLAKGELIPIIIFVLIFGSALASIGEINRPVVSFFESLFAATMRVTDWLMMLATPGIFALTASTVANSGVGIFKHLFFYIATVLIGLFMQLFITYPLLLKLFSKVNFASLYKAIAEAMMVAFGTASSSATLPVTIACCERRAGISGKICSFVLPLGATMSMDGTAMFQTIATIFIAQAYGIHLGIITILQICILAIIASSTAAGIPSAGLITLVLILNGIGLTPDQIIQVYAFMFAIDRFLDMFRTLTNVTSDTVVASIIAENEGELDYDLLGNQEVWKEVV